MPGANVFTYGYPPGNSISAIAQDLIRCLDNERLNRSTYEVPIAFVAHGTGGLIVKQVGTSLMTFAALDIFRLSYCWLHTERSLRLGY